MSVQIIPGEDNAQSNVGTLPLQILRISPGNSGTPAHLPSPVSAWAPLNKPDSVGIQDFIFYPQCTSTDQVVSPQDYQMFILTKPNSLFNIVLVRHSFLREVGRSSPITFFSPVPHRLIETWAISNRLSFFCQEAASDYPGRSILLYDLARIITILLLRSISKSEAVPTAKRKTKDIRLAIEYMHNYYYKAITLEELARQVNYSQYHFIRIFKKETGKSPFEYLTDIRLEKAKKYLSSTKISITEISFQCGFQNSSHFATSFKLHNGMSPSRYRNSVSS